jgi:hypothetical protein
MNIKRFSSDIAEHGGVSSSPLPDTPEVVPPAWEMIEAGRYMPRRIRGSCLGRELG